MRTEATRPVDPDEPPEGAVPWVPPPVPVTVTPSDPDRDRLFEVLTWSFGAVLVSFAPVLGLVGVLVALVALAKAIRDLVDVERELRGSPGYALVGLVAAFLAVPTAVFATCFWSYGSFIGVP